MLQGNRLFVPTYQRAYSWDTETDVTKSPKQINVFLSDLESHIKSSTKSPYYFGHFLFEEKPDKKFGVIDGQQRLTTIIIFLSVLFQKLKSIRHLKEDEQEAFEDTIKRNSTYRFETVDFDSQLFKDYVIDQIKKDRKGLETESAKRIVKAFDFFSERLSNKDEMYLSKMLDTVRSSICTNHPVTDESEAIQMFIFQNNRGKKPSNLEIIKAQFMFNIHLYGGEEKDALLKEIKNRFEKIYMSISKIEYRIDEDDVLTYTLRVYFNSLWESNVIERINRILSEANPISFIQSFTHSLAVSFDHLKEFFGKDERDNIEIHSLVTLGGFGIAMPFVIKAYSFNLGIEQVSELCASLESLLLRHKLIGTRAEIISRINDVYQKFTSLQPSISPIVDRIKWMKKVSNDSWWWSYWNENELNKSIKGGINHSTAKFLLWKYENFLGSHGKKGYSAIRFNQIENPELEHIAPQTPTNDEPIAAGYCEYDDEFKNQYIHCIGNYLLISKSHNCSVGNKPFIDKYNSYIHLSQQREIQRLAVDRVWNKSSIKLRKEKISKFIIDNL